MTDLLTIRLTPADINRLRRSDVKIRERLRELGLDTRREFKAWMEQPTGDYCYQGYRAIQVTQ